MGKITIYAVVNYRRVHTEIFEVQLLQTLKVCFHMQKANDSEHL